MSDELNKNEEAIKGILEGMSFDPGSTDDLWAKLEGQLPPEKKKRHIVPFWWLSGISFLVILSLGLGYYLAKLPQADTQLTTSNDTLPAMASLTEESSAEVSFESSPIKENTRSIIDATQKVSEVTSTRDLTPSENVTIIERDEKTISTKIISPEVRSIANQITEPLQSDVTTTEVTTTASIFEIEKPNNKGELLVTEAVSEIKVLRSLIDADKVSSLNGFYLTSNSRNIETRFVEPIKNNEYGLFFRVRGGVYQGIGTTYDITSIGEFDMSQFDREQDMLSTGLGIDVGTYIGRWKVFGGIGKQDVVSRYTRRDEEYLTSSEMGTEFIVIDDSGNSSLVQGTVNQTARVSHDLQWHRRHSMIDLHVGVGTDVIRYGKLSIGVEALLGYNISTSHSGYYFENTAEGFTRFNEGESNPYAKNMSFSAAFSTPVSFDLGQVVVGVMPTFRYQPTSFTNNHFYKTKNSQIGVQLCIAYMPRWE